MEHLQCFQRWLMRMHTHTQTYLLLFMCVIRVCAHVSAGALRVQERVSDLELEFKWFTKTKTCLTHQCLVCWQANPLEWIVTCYSSEMATGSLVCLFFETRFHVVHHGLQFIPVSMFWVLRLQVYATTPIYSEAARWDLNQGSLVEPSPLHQKWIWWLESVWPA